MIPPWTQVGGPFVRIAEGDPAPDLPLGRSRRRTDQTSTGGAIGLANPIIGLIGK